MVTSLGALSCIIARRGRGQTDGCSVSVTSSVLLALISREDVAKDLGANRFDGDSVRSSREQQGLLLISRFVG